MGNDIQRVEQLGGSIRQLRDDMEALSKIAPQVEKMVALAETLSSTTKNINDNMVKITQSVKEADDKTKKVKELLDKLPSSASGLGKFF